MTLPIPDLTLSGPYFNQDGSPNAQGLQLLRVINAVKVRTGGIVSDGVSEASATATGGATQTLAEWMADVEAVTSGLAAHLADTTAAHAASAISYAGGTGMSATDVEGAIDELATEKLDATTFSARTLTAGLGISGGGDLSADRSFAFAPSELTNTAVTTLDFVVLGDQSASEGPIKRDVASFISDLSIWTANNDGSGSGLDADLLDGKNTGTSGNTIPLLDGANTWSALQIVTRAGLPVQFLNTSNSSSVQALRIDGDRSAPAANDTVFASIYLSDSAGTQKEMVRLSTLGAAVSAGSEDGRLLIGTLFSGTLTTRLHLSSTELRPGSNDGLAIGAAGIAYSDAYFAAGAVLNFNSGNMTITHAAGVLTVAGGQFALAALASASTPDLTWSGDSNFGIRRTGADAGALVSGGADVAKWDSAGMKDASDNIWQVGGKHLLPLPAAAFRTETTNGATAYSAELATNKQMIQGWAFNKDTDKFIQCWIPMPKSWNEGTFTAKIRWYAPSGSGNVVWGVQALAVSDDDALDASWGSAQTVTDALTATGDVMVTAETSAITAAGSPAEGDMLLIRVYRDADNASDTFSADAILLAVDLFPSINGANDA